mgnify:CR=1 FL=1
MNLDTFLVQKVGNSAFNIAVEFLSGQLFYGSGSDWLCPVMAGGTSWLSCWLSFWLALVWLDGFVWLAGEQASWEGLLGMAG